VLRLSNSSVNQTTPSEGTKTTTFQADLLIPTYGVTPNTSSLPASMLDARGYVKQTSFLHAEGHDAIFVVGDAGNLQDIQGVQANLQVVHVVKLIEARLLAAEGEG
jgi:NADH dehydrogenase FAD-containing subunit